MAIRLYRSSGVLRRGSPDCHHSAMIDRGCAIAESRDCPGAGIQWRCGRSSRDAARKTMHTTNRADAIAPRVWRDLAALAVEAIAIGLLFSILLALAVLVMERARPDDRFAGAAEPIAPAQVAATLR
jgi:hypothetical protein